MLSLQPRYMHEIREGSKRYEYRRRYRTDRTRAFIYENAPVGAITAMLELDEPIVAPPAEIARIADSVCKGHGASVLEYMCGLEVGFAVPIRAWKDIDPVGPGGVARCVSDLRPTQSYMLLDRYPPMRDLVMQRWRSASQ